MVKKKRMGRGLDALLGGSTNTQADTEASDIQTNSGKEENLKELPIEFLRPGKYQPRKDMSPEALEELAASIKSQGLINAIIVRPLDDKYYEILGGERRWRAFQMLGLDKIPAVIKEVSDEAAIIISLMDNIQREDLNPMEEAEALHRLSIEFDLSHQQVADAVGKSRATVSNLLRLMNLGQEARKLLEHGDIDMGHARAILSLPEGSQSQIARLIVARGLSVRQTEAEVRKLQKQENEIKPSPKQSDNTDVRRLQNELSEKLGAPVSIQHSVKGRGKLVISYHSLDELDGILAHIK